MLAGGVRTYLNRYATACGSRTVIATTNDSAYTLVEDLAPAGLEVAAVIDSRPAPSAAAQSVLEATGVRGIHGAAVVGAAGNGSAGHLSAVDVRSLDADGAPQGASERIETDLLAVSGGFSPVVHLHSQRQGRLAWDEDLAAWLPVDTVAGQQMAGAAAGAWTLASTLADGTAAGTRAAEATGSPARCRPPTLPPRREWARSARCGWWRGPRKDRRLDHPFRGPAGDRRRRRGPRDRRWHWSPSSTSSGTPRSPRRTTRARPAGSTPPP